MSKQVLIDKKILENCKIRLDAQLEMFDSKEFKDSIPLIKKPIAKAERKALKKLIKQIEEIIN